MKRRLGTPRPADLNQCLMIHAGRPHLALVLDMTYRAGLDGRVKSGRFARERDSIGCMTGNAGARLNAARRRVAGLAFVGEESVPG